MYKFTKRLGFLKPKLKSMHCHNTSHISNRVVEAKANWATTQILLDGSPQSKEHMRAERELAMEFFQLSKDGEQCC
ncbi:hypothetical protein NC651_032936 [Populus alba x Populus x berolinensis]|nr:hypothetical protein NC651_032936 [Populus alba x Populus x berolinensis]